jgi:hypothetical protein
MGIKSTVKYDVAILRQQSGSCIKLATLEVVA